MSILKSVQSIPLSNGGYIKINSLIGEGGQGEVYSVEYNKSAYALKWYKQNMSSAFYENLKNNILSGVPNKNFLWPKAITGIHQGKFGYIMPLRPSGYKEFSEFLTGGVRFASWELMINAALNIVQSFHDLHSDGYSYQDLNEGSFFINPNNGDVLICDNDNVAPYGINLGVKGTPKYMAPEVVINTARPNSHTDRFSLAVILFRLFYIDHPLEGRYTIQFPLTDSAGAELFGKNPVFVFDPKNDKNRPDPTAHGNVIQRWNIFPPDLKSAFVRSFTSGLRDVNSRLTEEQWIDILVRVRSMLIRLNNKERFVNAYNPKTYPDGCMLLMFEDSLALLAPESKLYPYQTTRASLDYTNPSAIVKKARSENLYGLNNLTKDIWKAEFDGKTKNFTPGSYVPLVRGMTINFGTVTAKVY